MDKLEKLWISKFPNIPPIGFELKYALHSRWIRFHTLPNSKRYAESATEYADLLNRANTLAEKVLGCGADCWLVASVPLNDLDALSKKHWQTLNKRHQFESSFEYFDLEEDPADQTNWTIFSKKTIWKRNAFNEEIKDIADDKFPRLFWVSSSMGSIFAPYDGGFDLIVSNEQEVEKLRAQFPEWLSKRPDGL